MVLSFTLLMFCSVLSYLQNTPLETIDEDTFDGVEIQSL